MAINENKKLYRSNDAIIGGVCAGIADYFEIDVTLVRIITVVLVLVGMGFPIIAYIICLIAVPKQNDDYSAYIDVKPVTPPQGQQGSAQGQQMPPQGQYPQGEYTQGQPIPPYGGQASATEPTAAWQAAASPTGTSTSGTGTGAAPGACYTATNPVAYDASTPETHNQQGERITPSGTVSVAIIIGIILVAIGILALVGKVIGVSIWRFWPLALILVGLVEMFTPGKEGWSLQRAGGGIVTISIGIVLQSWMLGIVAFSTFLQGFLQFWPVLLVVIGLAVIGSALKKNTIMLLSSLVFSAALIFGVWYYGDFSKPVVLQFDNKNEVIINVPEFPGSQQQSSQSDQRSLDLAGIETANLLYKGGVTNAEIGLGDSTAAEFEVLGASDNGLPQLERSNALYLMDESTPKVVIESVNVIEGGTHSIRLPGHILWQQIDIEAGASSLTLDLEGLEVKQVNIDSGVSDIAIRLGEPQAGSSSLDLNAGISSTSIEVPEDSAVIIYTEGLNSVTVDQESFTWSEQLGAWCSNAYLSDFRGRQGINKAVWTINQQGMSALDVRTYQ